MNKKYLALHLSKTSLAGAPLRIVNALNKYTEYEARLVDYMPITLSSEQNMFDEDIDWQDKEKRKEFYDLIKRADIIHMHHFMNTDITNPFMVDLNKSVKPTCRFLRHFHSDKSYIAKTEIRFEENFAKDNLPKVVIPHYPERAFLDLKIVPNLIPINEPLYMPAEINNEKLKVVYSASNRNSYLAERWATKGYPEVSSKLKQLSEEYDFEYIEINDCLFKDAMKIKQQADIVIGDIVTGSYHLTELEALSMGKPTLTYMDGRSVMTFLNTFKTNDIPFINVNIDNLEYAINDLMQNKELRIQIGEFSRKWIEKYYDESVLVQRFVEVYNDILSDKPIFRENSNYYPMVKNYLYNDVYNYNWNRLRQSVNK